MKGSNSTAKRRVHRHVVAKGEYGAARTAVRWAAGLDPANPIYTHAAALAADKAGRYDEAEVLYRRAISDLLRSLGPSHPHLVTVACGLAQLYEHQHRDDEARRLCREIVAGTDRKIAEMANSRVLRRFAELCRRADAAHVAIELYRRAITFRCRVYGNSHPIIARYLAGLADLYRQTGRDAEARAVRKRAARLSAALYRAGDDFGKLRA